MPVSGSPRKRGDNLLLGTLAQNLDQGGSTEFARRHIAMYPSSSDEIPGGWGSYVTAGSLLWKLATDLPISPDRKITATGLRGICRRRIR